VGVSACARATRVSFDPDVDLFVVRGNRLVRRDGVPRLAFGPRVFRFGAFELDESRFELRRNGRKLRISRRVFDVLVFLVENASRTVTLRELLDGPYRGAQVTSSAVSRSIHFARKALGDDTKRPRLILTVYRKGFRFVPPAAGAVLAARAPRSDAKLGKIFGGSWRHGGKRLPFKSLP